jgi:ABC-type uncharacterized transport system substrate-binding protein
MNIRKFFIVVIAAVTLGGIVLYKKFSTTQVDSRTVCIFSSNAPDAKNDIRSIRQALQLFDIKPQQIVENKPCEKAYIKIFLDQNAFDESIKKDDASLKIGVRLRDPLEEEDSKVMSIFEEDNGESLIELVETTVKSPISLLLIYDETSEHSKRLANQYLELAKIKELPIRLCVLTTHLNISTLLKEVEQNINAVICIPGQILFQDAELILEHFKAHKIPVFVNHAGLIRSGAFGGYDFDITEIAHSIAEVSSSFLRDPNNVKNTAFNELYPQLHLNMDTIKYIGIQLEPDLLDEAITVGGADL